MAPSKGKFIFRMEKFIIKRGETRPPATLGRRGTLWRTWGSILLNASIVYQVLKILSNCICLTSFTLFLVVYVFVVKTISQIATTSPTRQQSPRLCSGDSPDDIHRVFRPKVLKMKTFSQLLWLAQLELESVLQPDLHLSGNVATKRPRDLRKPDNQLHQCNIRADEKELS